METHEEFMARLHKKNLEFQQFAVDCGWWESFTEDGKPVPFADVFVIETRELRRNVQGLWKTTDKLEDHENMISHILVKFGLFESVSDAKKNGWHKPIVPGEFWLSKKTKRVIIVQD